MKSVFLSYCSKDSDIADIVEEGLATRLGNRIKLSRYTRDVHYRESFKEFMDSIRDHDFVIAIVSDSYLRSIGCLYEVGEVLKERDYTERLHFIVLQDSEDSDKKYYTNSECNVDAKIFNIADRTEYLMFWQTRYNNCKQVIAELDDDAAIEERIELHRISKIKNFDLPKFLGYLKDHNAARLSSLIKTDFEEIVVRICPESKSLIGSYDTYAGLLRAAILAVSDLTRTDYNQIILSTKTESHSFGLVVFADRIGRFKQKYRLVVTNGVISQSFTTNSIVCIGNVAANNDYFEAVGETRSELAIPIRTGNEVFGVINSESEEFDYYTEEMVGKIDFLAGKIAAQLQTLGFQVGIDANDLPYVSLNVNDS